ncbi:hypothetical protein D9M71_592220 [compost metagenome]
MLGGDADAVVLHGNGHAQRIAAGEADTHHDPARAFAAPAGELEGIADQVVENLPQTQGIGADPPRHIVGDVLL